MNVPLPNNLVAPKDAPASTNAVNEHVITFFFVQCVKNLTKKLMSVLFDFRISEISVSDSVGFLACRKVSLYDTINYTTKRTAKQSLFRIEFRFRAIMLREWLSTVFRRLY